jgi:hypothetical protein
MRLWVLIPAMLVVVAGCDCDPGGFQGDAPVDGVVPGNVSLAWSLTDLNRQPIQCAQVGAGFVAMQLSSPGLPTVPAESFACDNSPGVSAALAPGVYDVTFALTGAGLTPVVPPPQRVTVASGRTTELAPVTFMLDAQGGVVFTLATPPAANCRPPSMNGAGITGVTITLELAGGGCAPVTFARARGATPLGSYTVNCSSPQVAPCIERDETLSVTSMASGPYTIHVRGKVGAVDCWRNDNAVRVPAQGKQLIETLTLELQTGTPGC